MRILSVSIARLAAPVYLALSACGGGSTPTAGIDGTGDRTKSAISVGAVTGFGSVVVNGVRYDTTNANVTVDGEAATESDLAVGDVVLVSGSLNDDGTTGSAESVTFDDNVEGPITFIDATTDSFIALGQIVSVFQETSFDDSIVPASLAGLNVDDVVEVSGFVDSNGDIKASRIERRPEGGELEVTGVVSSLNSASSQFNINALVVDFSSAMLEDFPSGSLNDGDLVEVKGDDVAASGELVATRVSFRGPDAVRRQGDHAEIEGFVTRFVSATDFDVSGFPATTDDQTTFVDGDISDLFLNTKLEVEGEFDAGGILVASRVIFRSFSAFGNIHLEPNDGLNGAGLLTDHASDQPGPPGSVYDYSGRVNLMGCEQTLEAEWFIDAGKETIGNSQVIRATGRDLIIDIVNAGVFDRCYGATDVDNGLLELSLRKVGTSCEGRFKWNFDYTQTSAGATEFFTMESVDAMVLEPPFDDCGSGGSNKLKGEFNFFRNTDDNGTLTTELVDTVFLDFFVVFHLCPGGTGC